MDHDEGARLEKTRDAFRIEWVVGLDTRTREQESMPLVPADEALGHVDAFAAQRLDALGLETARRALERRGDAAEREKRREHGRVERAARSGRRDHEGRPDQERRGGDGDLPPRVGASGDEIRCGARSEQQEPGARDGTWDRERSEPLRVDPLPVEREQHRQHRHRGNQVVLLTLARHRVDEQERDDGDPECPLLRSELTPVENAPSHEPRERQREKPRVPERAEPEPIDRIGARDESGEVAVATELPHVLLEDEVTQDLAGVRVEQRPQSEACEGDDAAERDAGRALTEEGADTPLVPRESGPCPCEGHGCDQREGLEQRRHSEREPREQPRARRRGFVSDEHQRQRKEHEQRLRRVGEEGTPVLKRREEAHEGRAREQRRPGAFPQPARRPEDRHRRQERHGEHGHPQRLERERAGETSGRDTHPE